MSNIYKFKLPKNECNQRENNIFTTTIEYELETIAFALMDLKKKSSNRKDKEYFQKVLNSVAQARRDMNMFHYNK